MKKIINYSIVVFVLMSLVFIISFDFKDYEPFIDNVAGRMIAALFGVLSFYIWVYCLYDSLKKKRAFWFVFILLTTIPAAIAYFLVDDWLQWKRAKQLG